MLRKSMTHGRSVVGIIYIERFSEPLLNIRAPKEVRSRIRAPDNLSEALVSGFHVEIPPRVPTLDNMIAPVILIIGDRLPYEH